MENYNLLVFSIGVISYCFMISSLITGYVVGALKIKNEDRLDAFSLIYFFFSIVVIIFGTAGFGCFIGEALK